MSQESQESEFLQRKKAALTLLKKSLKRAEKRLLERQENLHKCNSWSQVHHEGLLIQANLFRIAPRSQVIVVEDWLENGQERTISLESRIEPHLQAEARFRKSKKLKAGIVHAQRLLANAEKELAELNQKLHELEAVLEPLQFAEFIQKHKINLDTPIQPKKALIEKPKPYRQYVSQSGVPILVGKGAKDNHQLTFHYAHGSDWWLHAHDFPGSHVVIKAAKNDEIDEETLKDAAELALRFSKHKPESAGEVCLAQVKWLRPVKGMPGKVLLSKHKILRIEPNKDRWLRLKGGFT